MNPLPRLDPELSDLLLELHRTPIDGAACERFLKRVASLTGSMATLLLLPQASGRLGAFFSVGGTPEGEREYRDQLLTLDPFVRLPKDKVMTLDEFVTTEALLSSEFYQLYLAPRRVRHVLGVDIGGLPEFDARFRLSRSESAGAFGDGVRTFVTMLVPHVKVALSTFARVIEAEADRTFYSDTVARFAIGAIIVTRDARILEASGVARSLLKEGDGIAEVHGRLALTYAEQTGALRDAIRDAADRGQPGQALPFAMRVPRSNGGGDLALAVEPAPFPPGEAIEHRVVVLVSDPDRSVAVSPGALATLFGLTPAEAGLCVQLVDGASLDEAAVALGITRNTVRAHLRSIFAKTGVDRQSRLIRLILGSVAPAVTAG